MTFLNFPLSDWATLITIVGSVVGIIVWSLRVSIMNPMKESNRNLQDMIDSLKQLVNNINSNASTKHDEFDKRLDRHETVLTRHDEQLKTLFKKRDEND